MRTRDAADNDVKLWDPWMPRPIAPDEMDPDQLRRIRDDVGSGLIGNEKVAIWFFAALMVMGLASLPGARKTGPHIFVIAMYALCCLVLWLIARARRSRRIIRAMLAESRCPSCTYDLRACPTAVQGVLVCPECGAAWKA